MLLNLIVSPFSYFPVSLRVAPGSSGPLRTFLLISTSVYSTVVLVFFTVNNGLSVALPAVNVTSALPEHVTFPS